MPAGPRTVGRPYTRHLTRKLEAREEKGCDPRSCPPRRRKATPPARGAWARAAPPAPRTWWTPPLPGHGTEPRPRRHRSSARHGRPLLPLVRAPPRPAPAPAPRNPPPWACRVPCPAVTTGAGACARGAPAVRPRCAPTHAGGSTQGPPRPQGLRPALRGLASEIRPEDAPILADSQPAAPRDVVACRHACEACPPSELPSPILDARMSGFFFSQKKFGSLSPPPSTTHPSLARSRRGGGTGGQHERCAARRVAVCGWRDQVCARAASAAAAAAAAAVSNSDHRVTGAEQSRPAAHCVQRRGQRRQRQ